MFDKKVISEIEDWNHIDYICIKSKKTGIHTDVYYLDGHTVFETSLTEDDRQFINFAHNIDCYGVSEKMIGTSSSSDRFYVRVNIKNEQQELKLIQHLIKDKKLSVKQKQVLDWLRNLGDVRKEKVDYRSLYFCGFSKRKDSTDYGSIRFYFRTFGVDESLRYDADFLSYCEQCPEIKNDMAFSVVRNMALSKEADLRCIGVDISKKDSVKIKYYLNTTGERDNISRFLLKLKEYPEYMQSVDELLKVIPSIEGFYCDLVQISGKDGDNQSINLYMKKKIPYSAKYYSIKEGLVLRNIGGVNFLIDIHEKHYYDLKNLFSVNETGKCIIEYFLSNGVATLDGVVAHLRSLIKDYKAELYPVIYSDCEAFIEMLQENGYLQEVD